MYRLRHQEQIALIIGISLVILLILEVLFFSNSPVKMFFLGSTTICASLIIMYVFIIQPMKEQIRLSSYNQDYTIRSPSFRPTIIPPPTKVKKTTTRGSCEHCGKKELMGFTCSYCDGYFCTEHRLPEKHACIGLRRQ